MDPERRAPLSPDCHMTPVFDERTFHSPIYHSPVHEALYRSNAGTATHTFFRLNSFFLYLVNLIPFLCLPALISSPQPWGPSLKPRATAALCRSKEAATEWPTRGCSQTPTGSLENLSSPTVTLVWWTESPLAPPPSRASTRTPGIDTGRRLALNLHIYMPFLGENDT